MFRSILSCIILLILLHTIGGAIPSSTVNSNVGAIRGVRGDYFTSFLGIPYGLVDEKNPFGPATPHPHLKTIFDASHNPPVCPQMVNGTVQGSLDCLRLNVYTPNKNSSAPLPVMLYIFGGNFTEGNGNMNTYSPKFLVQLNIIVVAINYRVGPYGFLCWDKVDYNNQGLKDQKLGMKWVKDNIASFGGDENNIVLFGSSSGSISADYHLMYNNDVFDKVILQSGQFVSPINYLDPHSGIHVAKRLGMKTENKTTDDYINFLTSIEVDDLIKLTRNEMYRICIDESFKHNSLDRLKDIKILIGGTDKEGGIWNRSESFFKQFNVTSRLLLGFSQVIDEMVEDIERFYMRSDIIDDIVDFSTDFYFGYPIERSIKLYLENNATVYRYVFVYDGNRNYIKTRKNITYKGAIHADELGYEFDMDMFGNNTTIEDENMIMTFTNVLTNFAKHGSPEHNSLRCPKTNLITKPYMLLNGSLSHVENHPFKQRMDFWEKFYELHRKRARTVGPFDSFEKGLPQEE